MNYVDEHHWINPYHGLELSPGFEINTRDNENGILFLTEYLFLKSLLGTLTLPDVLRYEVIIEVLQSYNEDGIQIQGLYDRGAGESLNTPPELLRTISRDNLMAISSGSRSFNLPFNEHIFKHGMRNQWRFDNVYPESPRWARFMWNVVDIVFMMRMSKSTLGRVLAFPFMWIFYLAQIYSIAKKYKVRPVWYERLYNWVRGKPSELVTKEIDTSGPLLVFTKMFPLYKESWVAKLVWKFCTFLVDRNFDEGWKSITDSYYRDPIHPVRILMAEVWKKNHQLFQS